MFELKITETVPASSIWPTAEDHVDYGAIPGLLRGYNIEVKTQKGVVDWMSAAFIYGEPEGTTGDSFNDEWRIESRKDWGFEPTGRITFRGYYTEEYDFEERETFVKPVAVDEEFAKNAIAQAKARAAETDSDDECPLGGDISDDCAGCAYAPDYHYVNGECIRR